ncbi:lactonase family protein [Specibacter sp. RAF43]|uniref:lactonase family protein n=1 Tax=Specibacter sp. RAF43 TaxID=3233057 RepID=UPI003F9E401C
MEEETIKFPSAAVPGSLVVGGYTEAGYGAGPGLARHVLAPDGTVGAQAARGSGVRNPSFLAASGRYLLAVEELPAGRVAALEAATLALVGRAPTGGADPCHVLPIGDAIWVANYSSGTTAVASLADLRNGADVRDGTTPVPLELLSHPGSGPVADRQDASHCHQVTATPWGTVLVCDLGADRLDEYKSGEYAPHESAGGRQVRIGSAELPPGTGPRHAAIRGDFLLVAGELDGHLHVLRRVEPDPATGAAAGHSWRWLFKVPMAAAADDIGVPEAFLPSHIELSADEAILYGAVRGPNTLVAFDVTGLGGATPTAPRLLRVSACGGDWPRHFALTAARMYVANQRSNTVTVLALDADGLPAGAPVQTVDFGSPSCVVLI